MFIKRGHRYRETPPGWDTNLLASGAPFLGGDTHYLAHSFQRLQEGAQQEEGHVLHTFSTAECEPSAPVRVHRKRAL